MIIKNKNQIKVKIFQIIQIIQVLKRIDQNKIINNIVLTRIIIHFFVINLEVKAQVKIPM